MTCSQFTQFITDHIIPDSQSAQDPHRAFLRHRYRSAFVKQIAHELEHKSPSLLICFDALLKSQTAHNIYQRILAALRKTRRTVYRTKSGTTIRLPNRMNISNLRANKVLFYTRKFSFPQP